MTGANYTFSMLSYKSTDVAAFEPRIQHKRIVTGKRKGDWPQSVGGPGEAGGERAGRAGGQRPGRCWRDSQARGLPACS